MKTIAKLLFVIAIVTFLFACTKEDNTLNNLSQTTGQSVLKRNNTSGSTSVRFIWSWDSEYGPYSFPVYCDGVYVETLVGPKVTVHMVSHYQKGVWVWDRYRYSGELIGDVSGEHFKAADEFIFDGKVGIGTGHINLLGNNGTHYIMTYTYAPDPESPDPENNYIIIVVSAICH